MKTVGILIIAAFLPLLVSAQSAGQGVEKRQSKMDLFVSQTGEIVKRTEYKTESLSVKYEWGEINAYCRIWKIISNGKTSYFLRIENIADNINVAYIEYADLLDVIRAIEKMTGEMDGDMAMMPTPDYLENKFTTVDGFGVGYFVRGNVLTWFIRFDEYGDGNRLYFDDRGKDGGAYILDNFKKAAAMIEEMMRQDGIDTK